MPTYSFPNFKDPITANSWDWDFAGVIYIDGVSQDGFTSDITLNTIEGKKKGVNLTNDTDRPADPISETTLITWIEAELIKREI